MNLKINGKAPDWWLLEETSKLKVDDMQLHTIFDYDRTYKLIGKPLEIIGDGIINEMHILADAIKCLFCG